MASDKIVLRNFGQAFDKLNTIVSVAQTGNRELAVDNLLSRRRPVRC